MSSVNSDTYAAQIVQPMDAAVTTYLGRPLVIYEALVTAGTNFAAANDTANLFVVPAGLLPVTGLSRIVTEALGGTSSAIDIGTAANADAYCDGFVTTTATEGAFSGGVESLAPVATTAPTTVIATLATATASITAGKTFRVFMAFVKI